MKMTNEHKTFLNELRESGSTNMLAAAPSLAREFDLGIHDARDILSEWMRSV